MLWWRKFEAIIDYLIADPALRGRGLGLRMVAAAVRNTWPLVDIQSRRTGR